MAYSILKMIVQVYDLCACVGLCVYMFMCCAYLFCDCSFCVSLLCVHVCMCVYGCLCAHEKPVGLSVGVFVVGLAVVGVAEGARVALVGVVEGVPMRVAGMSLCFVYSDTPRGLPQIYSCVFLQMRV